MAETQKDTNSIFNVGGVLTHARSVAGGGGELVQYEATPIGGPPEINTNPNVRALLTFDVTTLIVGADQSARDAFVAKFNPGQEFKFKASPSGNGEMYITGQPTAIGRTFVVTSRNPSHSFQENSELNFTITEKGANT